MTVLELIAVILMCALISVFIYLRKEIALAFIIRHALDSLEPVKKEDLFAHNEAEIAAWRKENK